MAERLGVGREEVGGEREAGPARNSPRISSGETPKLEDDPVAARDSPSASSRVPLELEPPARLEADDPERPRADAALGARADGSVPSGTIAVAA